MNVNGVVITAAGTILTAAVTILLGYFVKRTDRAARITQSNLGDQDYVMRLVAYIRDDYWALRDWALFARGEFERLFHYAKMSGCDPGKQNIVPLSDLPAAQHRQLEARHNHGEPLDDKD